MAFTLAGCASLIGSATGGMADRLGAAILNQDDPETVRDGAPAFLLMLDSFVEGSPDDAAMLRAAAELYAAYGTVFVDDPARAQRLTRRGLDYGRRALCADNAASCESWSLPFDDFSRVLGQLDRADSASAYTAGLAWLAFIRAHREDWSALAELPGAEALLLRVSELDRDYRPASVAHLLGVMNTLRPPALGGRFEEGQAHFERAIELSGDRNLGFKVDYARYYARTLYDRELHDELLEEVMAADPREAGLTLMNTIAQREARALLDSANDYF
ncbi:MAG: hypothetical protein HKN58_11240 [Xanthomonadales bacterium]|nr:hypothetical protein [Xanthomonadales bacterium]